MADIKFRCPECEQKIAVEASAAGVKIDCPTCHSQLVIPRASDAPVQVTVQRKLAIVGGSADAMYADLQKAQAQAKKAEDELNELRGKQTATLEEFRNDLEALRAARDALEKEAAVLRPVRDELTKAKAELARATARAAQSESSSDAALQLRAELSGLQAAHTGTLKQLGDVTARFTALQHEHDELSKATTDAVKLQEQLTDARKEIERARRDAETAVAAHAAQLDAAKGIESGVRAELASMQTQHAQVQAKLEELGARQAELQAENKDLTSLLEQAVPLRTQLEQAQRDLCNICETHGEKVRGYESQLESAKNSETELRAQQDGLRAKLEVAHKQNAEQARQLDIAAKRAAELDEQTASVKQLLEAAQKSGAELQARHDDLQSKFDAAQKQNTEQAGRLEMTVKRVGELQAETAALKPLRDQLAAAQSEIERLKKDAEQAAKDRAEAAKKDEDTLAKARAAEKTLREYADGLNAKLTAAETRNAAITNGFTAIKRENGDLHADLSRARTERDDAAALAAEHAKEIAILKPAAEAAALELARLRAAADGTTKEKAALTAALEKAAAERTGALEHNRQQAAESAANKAEIERLTQLVAATEAAAKKAAPLPQPPASLKKKTEGKALADLERRLAENTAALEKAQAAEREAGARAKKSLEQMQNAEREAAERVKASLERAQAAEREATERAKASLERAEIAEREATERAKKGDEEKARLAAELSRKSAEFDSLREEAARVKAELEQIKSQPKEAPAALTAQAAPSGTAGASDREKALEAERDALSAALERAKQHVGVLQARRDMLRDEVATLRTRLGIGGKVTSGDEKPIAK